MVEKNTALKQPFKRLEKLQSFTSCEQRPHTLNASPEDLAMMTTVETDQLLRNYFQPPTAEQIREQLMSVLGEFNQFSKRIDDLFLQETPMHWRLFWLRQLRCVRSSVTGMKTTLQYYLYNNYFFPLYPNTELKKTFFILI
jgi:hypothetical protein